MRNKIHYQNNRDEIIAHRRSRNKPPLTTGSKACSVCKSEKSRTEFYPNPQTNDGRSSRCKKCDNTTSRKYTEQHREKLVRGNRIRYKNNRERYNLSKVAYYQKHKQEAGEARKRWRENNRIKHFESNRKYFEKQAAIFDKSVPDFKFALMGWGQAVRDVVSNTCQVCGTKSAESHHIIHRTDYPGLSLNLNNGMALCKTCHYHVHGKCMDTQASFHKNRTSSKGNI